MEKHFLQTTIFHGILFTKKKTFHGNMEKTAVDDYLGESKSRDGIVALEYHCTKCIELQKDYGEK